MCLKLCALNPALEFLLDEMDEYADAALAVIEARDEAELLSAMLKEYLACLDRDFFQRLHAIGGEPRRENGDPLHPVARERLHRLVRIRLEPLRAAEARLEREL